MGVRRSLGWIIGALLTAAAGGQDAAPSGNAAPAAQMLASFHLRWGAPTELRMVSGVYPHPNCPGVVAAAAADGVRLSQNAGRDWHPMPGTEPAKTGGVRHIAFLPAEDAACFLATEKGVWRADAGGCRLIGNKAGGMAADGAWRIAVYPKGRGTTLLVAHADAAPGLSRSEDQGRNWQVIAPEYRVRDLLFSRRRDERWFAYTPLMIAARAQTPKLVNIWSAQTVGDLWMDEMRDLIEAEGAADLLGKDQTFWATADKGLLRTRGSFNQFERIGPADIDEWTGVGVTRGPAAGSQIVYAFDPYEAGVLLSADGFSTWQARNDGLRLGRYVKSGAQVRASADGRTFYAVINGALQIARAGGAHFNLRDVELAPHTWQLPAAGYAQARARLGECERALGDRYDRSRSLMTLVRELNAARGQLSRLVPLELRISARADAAQGQTPQLRVDGSAIGCDEVALFDDGAHGDGAAGDGLYAAALTLRPDYFTQGVYYRNDKNERRRSPPLNGPQELPVTASAGGRIDQALAVLAVVTSSGVQEFTLPERPEYKFPVPAGAWQAQVTAPWGDPDITGGYALVLQMRADRPLRGPLRLRLRDRPGDALPAESAEVDVLADGFEAAHAELPDEFVRVVIPLEKFRAEGSAFQPALLRTLVFSGDAAEANAIILRDARFYATPEDVPAEEKP